MRRRGGFDKGFLLLLLIVVILAGTGVFLYEQIRTDKVAEALKKGQPIVLAIFVTDKSHLVGWRDAPTAPVVGPDGALPTSGDGAAVSPANGPGSTVAAGPSASGTATATGNGVPSRQSPAASTSSSGASAPTASGGSPLLFTEVFVLNPQTKKGAVMDVPGNVGSLISSQKRIDRIDVLFKSENVEAYRAKVGSLLGLDIPFYLEIDIRNIPRLVDLLGGLDLFIANPVEETNVTPMVLLPSGSLVLDGAKVQSFLSYKASTDSDIEVIGRRQKFVQALFKGIEQNAAIFQKPGVYSIIKDWVSTNMNKRSVLSLFGAIGHMDTERMVFQRVLGVNRLVDGQELLFPHYDGRLLQETVQQTLATLANPQALSDQALNAKLQILNGTLISGLAHRTSQVFQSFGYDVVSVGNADRNDYAQTLIVDRAGDLAQAQRVASIIKCTQVEARPAPPAPVPSGTAAAAGVPSVLSGGADVTIILGKDFDGRYCK